MCRYEVVINQRPECCSWQTGPKEESPLIFKPRKYQPQTRVNGRIRAREVRVILGSTNEQLGILKLQDAIKKAQSLGLDLVEVAANASPPVCRIVDFGKYRYEQSKQEKDRKNSGTRLKEVKFRVKIAEHDYLTKMRRAEAFLAKGNKVKVQLQFRGREMAHQELGEQLMQQVKKDLETMALAEMEPKKVGRSINMILSPLPVNRRKRKYTDDSYEPEEEDQEEEQNDDES